MFIRKSNKLDLILGENSNITGDIESAGTILLIYNSGFKTIAVSKDYPLTVHADKSESYALYVCPISC
jgi:hypothetical protein